MKNFVIITALVLLASCETPRSTALYIPPPRPDMVQTIRKDLEGGESLAAAVKLKNLEPLSESEGELKKDIQIALSKKWTELQEEEDFSALQNYSMDLEALGYTPGDTALITPGLEKKYEKKGWGSPLSLLIQDNLKNFSGEEKVSKARTLRNEGQYQSFVDAVTGLGSFLNAEDRKFIAAAPSSQTLLKGTATIIVNRGLKLQSGMGTPDIVIGSGFFIDKRGYLLTNYHVIQSEVDPEYEGYSRLYISLPNSKGERIPAKVIGWDSNLDVALIKAEVQAPYVFSFAPRPQLKEGDRLFAIGSPGGLEATITSGIVSAVGRKFLPLGDALQMDVAVNPGNSGGPLVDDNGWVVGLVFAGIPEFQGVNFAVSGVYIRKLIPWLYQGGEASHLWLGLGARDTWKGMEVDFVAANGPGYLAGIRPGMILTNIQETDLLKDSEIHLSLLDHRQVVKTIWEKDNEKTTVYLLRTKRPQIPLDLAFKNQVPEELIPHLFGMDLEDQGNPSYRWFRVTGVVPGSAADHLGLAVGDPVQLKDWQYIKESKSVLAQFFIKRRLGGYFESTVELGANLQSTRIF